MLNTVVYLITRNKQEAIHRSERLERTLAIGLTAALLAVAALLVIYRFPQQGWGDQVGFDRSIYVDGAQRWLHGGGFYLDRQLHGPYPIQEGDVLYPPTALWVFVPLSFLPAVLWWAIPIGFVAWSIWDWRPAMRAWPVLALFLAWPFTTVSLITGYPGLWFSAIIAAGLRWKWPGALILLKPSLLPFALIGIRTRGWWLTAALLVVLTLPLLAMVPAWLQVVFDGDGGLLYSIKEAPLMLLPLVAWLARERRPAPYRPGATEIDPSLSE